MSRLLLVLLAVMLTAAAAHAQPPAPIDPLNSSWSVTCTSGTMKVSNCPAGDFELVGNACGTPSTSIINYHLQDINGAPVIYLPATDIWFQPVNPSEVLYFKPGQPVADQPTDLAGNTWTTIALSAGGCSQLGLQCVALDPILGTPVVLQNPPSIVIEFKSPDLNASGIVDLSDLAIFALSYGATGTYNYCCDYNDDGVIDLSDLAFFASHYQHS